MYRLFLSYPSPLIVIRIAVRGVARDYMAGYRSERTVLRDDPVVNRTLTEWMACLVGNAGSPETLVRDEVVL